MSTLEALRRRRDGHALAHAVDAAVRVAVRVVARGAAPASLALAHASLAAVACCCGHMQIVGRRRSGGRRRGWLLWHECPVSARHGALPPGPAVLAAAAVGCDAGAVWTARGMAAAHGVQALGARPAVRTLALIGRRADAVGAVAAHGVVALRASPPAWREPHHP